MLKNIRTFAGIGKSIAEALLKCGAEVIVLERLKEDLDKFKAEVEINYKPIAQVQIIYDPKWCFKECIPF